ncbi:hypothetical protein O7632_30655 [Solwaraspora sp. WMMD406]|uniref:hypothetical protein n=1 Tax=Solwaraspora sp. WMMD406 TaxID=3016095 RepID=UPI002416275D|nr:hypothetical protein [Solwaraspora sp. WMMD406]MDG4768422.1 hypothetical protein [Solwaraspora sp. WMMD406]
MATTSNGDGWSDGAGAPDDLPEIPPEWGPVIVPDDPAALAAEAELVRRELRRTRRRDTWHRRFGIDPHDTGRGTAHRRQDRAALRLPLIIMLVAVLAAMVSLFTVAWSDRPRPTPTATPPAPVRLPSRPLPALDLIDQTGTSVPIRSLLPAVIMLVETCDCVDQIAATAATTPAGVSVVAVTSGAASPATLPAPVADPANTHLLADPAGELRGFVDVEAVDDTATVLLVTDSGDVVRLVPQARSIETYRTDLALLVGP